MITTVASVALPVDEKLRIQKNRIEPEKDTGIKKRISIVTGIHGDELEGQYVCFELNRRIGAQKEKLCGIVDIYPALNPLGIDSITRGIPAFELDMNRLFPGDAAGNMTEYLAARAVEDLSGSDLVMDIHASNIYLMEIPQIRVNAHHAELLLPLAEESNVDFVWVHGASTVLESTLAYSLNSTGTPTLVVEMGVGMRITRVYDDQLVDGIFHLMKKLGIWEGETAAVRQPIVSCDPKDVAYLNAATGGLFVPAVKHGAKLKGGRADWTDHQSVFRRCAGRGESADGWYAVYDQGVPDCGRGVFGGTAASCISKFGCQPQLKGQRNM